MPDNQVDLFHHAQMQALAETVASKVVEEMLVKLGIDPAHPLEAQHDFMALRAVRELLTDKDFQADLSHLRKWRQTMESGASKGIFAVTTALISGAIALLIMGFKSWVHPGS